MGRRRIKPLAVAVFIFLVVQVPIANRGIGLADEGFLVLNARQIMAGKVPYRDFFVTTTPGTYYLQAGLNYVFGNSLLVQRMAHIFGVICLLMAAWWVYGEEKFSGWYWVALAVAWVGVGAFAFYNMEAVILAVVMLGLMQRHKWLWAGAIGAVCVVFKQSIGIALLVVGLVAAGREVKRYLVGVATVLVPCGLYLLANGAGRQFWEYAVVFARQVKGHQADWVTHRLIFAPILAGGAYWFRRANTRTRKLLLAVAVLAGIVYVGLKPARVGRLVDYVIDPAFWFYTAAFAVPVAYIGWHWSDKDKEGIVEAAAGEALFLGIAASGYSFGAIATAGVMLWPVWLKPIKSSKIQTGLMVLLTVFILASSSLYTNKEQNEYAINREINILVMEIEKLTTRQDRIVCLPHCPMINVLARRDSGMYFNYFYFETFRVNDQTREISDLQKLRPKLVILQKKGEIDAYAEEEYRRLPVLTNFILERYRYVWGSRNFAIYELKVLGEGLEPSKANAT